MNLDSEMESKPPGIKGRKLVCGIGVNDAPFATTVRKIGKLHHHTAYKDWHNMINRCYSGKYPSYQDVFVNYNWLYFMNFHSWWRDNYREGFQLDKDLFGDGYLYSSSVCRYIPQWMNNSIKSNNKPGVHFHKSTGFYRSGRDGILGRYTDEDAAWNRWRENFYMTEDYDTWIGLDISIREKFLKLKNISL